MAIAICSLKRTHRAGSDREGWRRWKHQGLRSAKVLVTTLSLSLVAPETDQLPALETEFFIREEHSVADDLGSALVTCKLLVARLVEHVCWGMKMYFVTPTSIALGHDRCSMTRPTETEFSCVLYFVHSWYKLR